MQQIIQHVADTLNGWAAGLQALATRITNLAASAAPDFSPITAAVANVQTSLDAVTAAVTAKEAPAA